MLDLAQATEFFDVYKGVLKEYADVLPTFIDGPCLALQVRARPSNDGNERF